MNAKKMTNEMLAENLTAIVPFLIEAARNQTDSDEILREAAKRLRRPIPVDDDLLKMAGDIDKLRAKNADLRAKLKIAEDALVACRDGMCGECHRQQPGWICVNECYEMGKARNALAAIRGEGGAK